MKQDILIPLAFLSYYRYTYFLVDITTFFLISYCSYQVFYKELPKSLQIQIPLKSLQHFENIRKIVSYLFIAQWVCYLLLFVIVLFNKPFFIHQKTDLWFSSFLFISLNLLRVVNTIMLLSFVMVVLWKHRNNLDVHTKKYLFLIICLILFYLWMLLYLWMPSFNRALKLYEIFYNIRNLYIHSDPQKKYKTFKYIQQIGCVPEQYETLYYDEWKKTFKGPVMTPMECLWKLEILLNIWQSVK